MRKLKTVFILLLVAPCAFAQPGANDPTFNPGTGFNHIVYSTSIQSDGKIIVGGGFTSFNGISRSKIARLNADGSLDKEFKPGSGFNSFVKSTAIQSDGKIIVGGGFTFYNGTPRNRITRLNAAGSLDIGFNTGTGFNDDVYSIAIQSDGKVIVGGDFTLYNGTTTNRITRLNPDGSLDTEFHSGTGFNGIVHSITIKDDGKIIVGGSFTAFNGTTINRIARLNPDGSLDTGFHPGTGFNDIVISIAIQSDGKIIVGGLFTSFNETTTNYIARLNADGNLDTGFYPGTGFNKIVYTTAIQNDGKIIVGGDFTSFNGTKKNRIVRLNPEGSLDTGFNPGDGFNIGNGFNNRVLSTAIQSDGKIIVGGYFISFNWTERYRIARLLEAPVAYNTITGDIYSDNNNDCQIQTIENRLSSIIVKALPGPYYGGSDAYGRYEVRVDSGSVTYNLTQQYNTINSKLLLNQCATSHSVSLTGASKETCCFNFANEVKNCALLNVSIQNTRMRRCFVSTSYVNYCNYGNSAAPGAQIKVVYPSYVVPLSSSPMWTSKQDSVLIYDLATLAPGACGRITITDSVICGNEAIRGLTQCIKATISPASNCVAEDPAWDRSSLKVSGSCVNEAATFVIKNGGSGNMASNHDYRVYVNDTLVYIGNFKLNSGESFTVSYPAAGQTIRLEADQHPLHPGKSRPRTTIENCGVASPPPNIQGLVITSPLDDLDEETAITCNLIIDSYDPNDKLAVPVGTGITKRILPGEEIEYTIRFQNTGTDVAYNVIIVDTLDINLDVASFTEGSSSHNYKLKISGNEKAVLTFSFIDINLPDSTTNELLSNGLVSFRITVPDNTPLGSIVNNKAYIYFDYNSPIITNETWHTVDIAIDVDLLRGELVEEGEVIKYIPPPESIRIYPNPTEGLIILTLPDPVKSSELHIFNLLGIIQKEIQLAQKEIQEIYLDGLKSGMYIYRVVMEGEVKGRGMIKVK